MYPARAHQAGSGASESAITSPCWCAISEIATYARVDNAQYRSLKATTPGPYTFILRGPVPRRVPPDIKRKNHRFAGAPRSADRRRRWSNVWSRLSSTLLRSPTDLPLTDPEEIAIAWASSSTMVIGAGLLRRLRG